MLTSIRGTQDCVFLWWQGKHCYSLAGKFWFTHRIHQTFHFQISIYFSLYKILLMEKTSIPWKTVKNHLEQFFVQKDEKFWEDGIMKLPEKWQKIAEKNDSTTILVNMLFNKVVGKNEKCVFYFYLKTEETFWPSQYFCIPRINLTWSWCIILLIAAEFCLLIFCWAFSFASVFMRDIGL